MINEAIILGLIGLLGGFFSGLFSKDGLAKIIEAWKGGKELIAVKGELEEEKGERRLLSERVKTLEEERNECREALAELRGQLKMAGVL